MKKGKQILIKVLVYAACLVIGGLIGVGIGAANISVIELVIALFIAYNLSVIVHESGHLVFGLISGYCFSSFRIWSLMIMKANGKVSFHKHKLAGTAGQCLMAPPDLDAKKTPVTLYNLGGVIFNLIQTVICLCVFFAVPDVPIISLTMFVTAIISALTLLTNGIPLNVGGVANDGMNALSLSKNIDAKQAFINQLRMNEAQTRGLRLREMPDEWFTVPDGADKSNVAIASTMVFKANRDFDYLDTEQSENTIKELLDSDWNIIGLHRNLLKCDLAFCRLINSGKSADISLITTPEMLNFRKAMKNYPSIIRTEYALMLIHDENGAEAEKKLRDFEKTAKTSPHKADIDSERELIVLAQKRHNNDIKNEAE